MSLTKEQIENLIEENNQKLRAELLLMASDAKPRTGMINCVSELENGDEYYVLHADEDISSYIFNGSDVDSKWINQGSAAWDKATLERQAKLNELNTRARAASAKAGVIGYKTHIQLKTTIHWDFILDEYALEEHISYKAQGVIPFPTTQSAINFMQSLTPDEQRLFAGGDV